jgi:hypothetical protein
MLAIAKIQAKVRRNFGATASKKQKNRIFASGINSFIDEKVLFQHRIKSARLRMRSAGRGE